MLLCLYSQCLIGIGLHFVQRLPVFMALRFVQGIAIQVILASDWSTLLTLSFVQGLQCVSYSMIMELFCPAYRTLAGCVAEAFWAGGKNKNNSMGIIFFHNVRFYMTPGEILCLIAIFN